MTMIRTIAPAALPVTPEEARLALRIDGEDLDGQIAIWLKGIVADLEHEIGQCVMDQTWEVRLAAFPQDGKIVLPHPAQEVTGFDYIESSGAQQSLALPAYRLNVGRYASSLTPARDSSWPATAEDEAAVTVTVKSGYGADPADAPDEIRLYVLARLTEQFDPVARNVRDVEKSNFVCRLLDRCRSYA